MATVGRDAELDERIDDFLSYLIGEWAAIPELAAEWEEWTPYERSDFVLEWPIREDRLAQLGQYDEAGLLTPALRAASSLGRTASPPTGAAVPPIPSSTACQRCSAWVGPAADTRGDGLLDRARETGGCCSVVSCSRRLFERLFLGGRWACDGGRRACDNGDVGDKRDRSYR